MRIPTGKMKPVLAGSIRRAILQLTLIYTKTQAGGLCREVVSCLCWLDWGLVSGKGGGTEFGVRTCMVWGFGGKGAGSYASQLLI